MLNDGQSERPRAWWASTDTVGKEPASHSVLMLSKGPENQAWAPFLALCLTQPVCGGTGRGQGTEAQLPSQPPHCPGTPTPGRSLPGDKPRARVAALSSWTALCGLGEEGGCWPGHCVTIGWGSEPWRSHRLIIHRPTSPAQ